MYSNCFSTNPINTYKQENKIFTSVIETCKLGYFSPYLLVSIFNMFLAADKLVCIRELRRILSD